MGSLVITTKVFLKAAVSASWSQRYEPVIDGTGASAEYHATGDGLAASLHADRNADLIILDLALVTPALVGHLDPHGARILAFGAAANAGAVLAGNLADFIPDDPSAAELEAAIADALAPTAGGGVGDLSDRAIARLGALGGQATRVADALARLEQSLGGDAPPVNAAHVRAMIRSRRARDRFFRPEIFGEPAWDMLLDLAAAGVEGRDVAVSSLCIAAAVPTTTALRWIKGLCDAGLFERRDDPSDARRAFISLSDEAMRAMAAYLAATPAPWG